jgi:hypothetical protein
MNTNPDFPASVIELSRFRYRKTRNFPASVIEKTGFWVVF